MLNRFGLSSFRITVLVFFLCAPPAAVAGPAEDLLSEAVRAWFSESAFRAPLRSTGQAGFLKFEGTLEAVPPLRLRLDSRGPGGEIDVVVRDHAAFLYFPTTRVLIDLPEPVAGLGALGKIPRTQAEALETISRLGTVYSLATTKGPQGTRVVTATGRNRAGFRVAFDGGGRLVRVTRFDRTGATIHEITLGARTAARIAPERFDPPKNARVIPLPVGFPIDTPR